MSNEVRNKARATARRFTFAASLAFGLGAAPALAQEHADHGEHAAAAGEHAVCTAESTDHECFEYWEHHINWVSWDYGPHPENPAHRHMPPPFAFALLNFAIFGYIMYRLAATPLKDFVRTRHLTIRKDLDEAARLHKEAEARLAEFGAKISGLESEIETLRAQVRSEAEAEKARIIAAAEKEAVRLKADAEVQIAREVAAVRRQLKAEAVAAAVKVAAQLVSTQASDADQARLTERFVADLEAPGRAASPSTRS